MPQSVTGESDIRAKVKNSKPEPHKKFLTRHGNRIGIEGHENLPTQINSSATIFSPRFSPEAHNKGAHF